MTSEASHSATSSPASADGATHSDSPAGPMTDLFGQALAPASPSAQRASSVAATMSATYGLRSSTSSASAALEQSLASRLPELLGTPGGITWQQTWKAKATPQRRRILAHTASGLRTSDSGCTGWPTPLSADGRGSAGVGKRELPNVATWATPTRSDHQGAATPEAVKQWESRGHNLPEQAQMAGWATPQSRDHKGAMNPGNELTHNTRPLNEQARLAVPGPTSNGSSAATGKPGQLNPAFSLWLMGYEMVAWLLAAPSSNPSPRSKRPTASTASAPSEAPETPSSRTSRRRS